MDGGSEKESGGGGSCGQGRGQIFCKAEMDFIGEKGEQLESCSPLQEPSNIDEQFVKQFITRCLCASYREPHLFSSFVINSTTLLKLLRKATLVCSQEENIVDVIVPSAGCARVFGDIHGDIHSLVSGLLETGLPSDENVLVFAGDYVDRGPWGLEVLLIVSVLKIWQPKYVQILRGNHETTGCIGRYGFEDEVKYKFSAKSVPLFVNLFRQLPLIAIIRVVNDNNNSSSTENDESTSHKKKKGNMRTTRKQALAESSSSKYPWAGPVTPGERRVIVMHGGLFRSEQSRKEYRNELARLTELMEISRSDADPYGNAIEDILWSDPQLAHKGIAENNLRGCGILYGEKTVEFFFQHNNIVGIIRAHEGQDMREKRPDMPDMQNGFSIDMDMLSGFVATVFSSANYPFQDPKGNKGAFATLFGKRHRDAQSTVSLPKFSTFDRFNPPPKDEVHLFYSGEASCCTPRQSFSA